MKTAAICIATYRRPEMLRRLLAALEAQRCPAGWEIEYRIVNNDAEGADAVTAVIEDVGIGARFETEPERNIALARNRAVDMGVADAFLFIDDDEIPMVGWLSSLLNRISRSDCDAAFGPVVGRLPEGTPSWLRRSGFFDKPGPDHDGRIDWHESRTSSAVVSGEWFCRRPFRFDPAYGLCGGSDTQLFHSMERAGARFVHCRGGSVYEDVEPDRCTWRSLLDRRFKAGAVYAQFSRSELSGERSSLRPLFGLFGRLGLGVGILLANLPFAVLGRLERPFAGLLQISIALGSWYGRNPERSIVRYEERPLPMVTPGDAGERSRAA